LEVPRSTFECRELRRRDLSTFGGVILQGMGAFEAATKIDVTTTESVKNLRRPGMVGLVRLLQLLQIAQVRILVAVDRGQVVGTTVVSFLPSTGYIGGVATDAAARGRGIATRLMELAEGSVVLCTDSSADSTGMVEGTCKGDHVLIFLRDLEERAVAVTTQLRRIDRFKTSA